MTPSPDDTRSGPESASGPPSPDAVAGAATSTSTSTGTQAPAGDGAPLDPATASGTATPSAAAGTGASETHGGDAGDGGDHGEDGGEGGDRGDDRSPARGRRRWVLEWLAVILVAVGVVIAVRVFVVQTFYIPSASMVPTLEVGDRIVVDKLSYRFHGVGRGDIIVFKAPPSEASTGVEDLVKRVIGLPGETIASGPRGEVLIDGKPIAQPWLTQSARDDPGPPISPQKLGPDEYFVMGDNRGDSEDSRAFGPIPRSSIVGRAVFRYWPLHRIGGL